MANNKKYISLNRLSDFLDNLKETFALLSHKHTVSDLTDYKVDTSLSSTSTNPVQNKVLDEEFNAVSDAIGALELAVDSKSDSAHNHDDRYYTETEIDQKISEKANLTHIHPYGVCSSSATYTTKTVTVDNFSLVEGARVIVKFTNANSASSPKLNVNSTGAIPIMRYGTTAAGSNSATNGWEAGAVLAFTYDGTNWVQDYWYNTTYTNASLGQGYGTCYTSSSTAEKTVSMSNYEDKTGGIVSIKFTYSVDAGATLNINSQGAMDIYYKGSAIIDDVIKGGDIATFICSGSTYHLISVDRWFEDIAELQANDRRVRQMPTSTNGSFRLLLTPSFQSEDTTAYTYFDSGVYLNPHYNTLYGADIDGSATGVKGVTSGNFLVGNDDENMVEKTPAEVLSMINGASVATMTTAEYNALETRNTNTLYMLTDAEEDNIEGLDNMVQINLNDVIEGEANLINAGTLNGKTEDMLSVAKAVNADKLNDKLPSYYAPATKLTPRNLLDNSDFRNPVNQRGQQSYTNNAYTIDRWQIWNGSLSIADGYITVDGMYQFLELPLDKVYTFAVCRDDGNITVVSGSPSVPVGVANDGMTINITNLAGYAEVVISGNKNVVWACLYEGEYTADTLPEYQYKGYAVELAECQRYYEKTDLIYDAINTTVDKTFPYKVNKRIPTPTATIYSDNGRVGYMSRYNTNTGIYEDVEVLFVESNAYGARVFSTNNGQFRFRMEISADL